MSKRKSDTPVKAVRVPRKRRRNKKRPARPKAELPEPIATYEL
jgi:hypothetical protein